MQKRRLIIGDYNTALQGLWTLTGWELSAAELITNFIEVPGRIDGPLDASTALTNGDERYGSRTLTALFESSEGTRLEREDRISHMVNLLDGRRLNIELPDDPDRYVVGRVRVERLYNDPAHASVQVTAICDPWRYNKIETVVSLAAASTAQTAVLLNAGRRAVTPVLTVSGGDVLLASGNWSRSMSPGKYILPDLHLTQGEKRITYSGAGFVLITYREAVL